MIKIISKKKYNELLKYKEEYSKVLDRNVELTFELGDVKDDNDIYKEQVDYLRNELSKYTKPKKKVRKPKKEDKKEPITKRKVGRPRKESK